MIFSYRRRAYTYTSGREQQRNPICRILFFPAVIVYLESLLHLYMRLPLVYLVNIAVFSMAGGLVLCALTAPFSARVNLILAEIFTALLCVLYAAQTIAKIILQSYYPLSTLGTAAGNRLGDYSDVIISTLLKNIPLLISFLLPLVLLFVFGRKTIGFGRSEPTFVGVMLLLTLLFHLAGLAILHLPWTGDFTPKQLYAMDSNVDDQVEQLGMLNMLRLDIKHKIFPVKQDLQTDFSALGGADSSQEDVGDDEDTELDTSPNVMDIDLAALASASESKDVQWLAEYFSNVQPTNKNEYTGMFAGYNVIQIVMEGFSGYAIDPVLTPTLYKLTTQGFVFNNYYTALHFTSTSNGECQTLLGLYPKNGNPITMTRTGELKTNAYFSLAQQLARAGYQVLGYHGNYDMYGRLQSHTNLGYDWRQYQSGLELDMGAEKPLWPQRDTYVVEQSVDDYVNSDTPFHVYYLTISGHMPYSNNRIVKPYLETVRALPYSETTQHYIATAMEVDRSLALLLEKLGQAGKLENTVIVATGDHIPYFNVDTLEELSGKKFGNSDDLEHLRESDIDFDVYKNSLIIWSASMEQPVQVDKPCCQVDILPTISNLLGLDYDSRMLDGSDILSDSEGLVVFTSRSWKTDRGFYNRYTQEFTPATGISMSEQEQEAYVTNMKKIVKYKLESTPLVVENDFYQVAFGGQ